MDKYSAGGISKDFWFLEFKKVSQLLKDGFSEAEIKQLNKEENIVNALSERRSREIVNINISRTKVLTPSYLNFFFNTTLENQKIITLISILLEDRLFLEFLNEVYKEKQLQGELKLKKREVENFFEFKKTQSEKINQWKDTTIEKLINYYLNNLSKAGLLIKEDKSYLIQKPYISNDLKEWLKNNKLVEIYKILAGESS